MAVMQVLALEPTNRCNRACLHCFRNKADAPESLPLEVAQDILLQARSLGIREICLTGGEVALYPFLEELIGWMAAQGLRFTLVTNGYRFEEVLLPLLLKPEVRTHLRWVALSLDGATAETHDALRGKRSFAEVAEAALLCQAHDIPLSLKSVITTLNQEEVDHLALLGAKLGARHHAFLYLFPTPTLVRKELLPTPKVMDRIASRIKTELARTFKHEITVEGFFPEEVNLDCGLLLSFLNVDYQGHLIFCCNLSHVTEGDGIPSRFGEELVADLKEVSLAEGIRRRLYLLARFMEERLRQLQESPKVVKHPCHWCMRYFGKLAWLKDFPDSPWAKELLPGF
jgi:MoaA/NifB/PqqE/SkfB family radical SAM enzyme